MRPLYFSRSYTVHDRRFLRAFAVNGVKAAFLSLRDTTDPVARFGIPDGIEFCGSLADGEDARDMDIGKLAERYAGKLSAIRPDIVLAGPIHDCGHIAALYGDRAPVVLQSWAFDVYREIEGDPPAANRTAIALRACAALFVDSEAVLHTCRQIAGTTLPREFVMPWGVDLGLIRGHKPLRNLRADLGLESQTIFVCVRGLAPVYGTVTLLEAFRKVHRRDARTALILAGDGELRDWTGEFIRGHGLEAAVFAVGQVGSEHVLDLLNAADFYTSCSLCDGASVSLLEAMACGLPVVVSDIPGNREWVTGEVNGWIAPGGATQAFTDRMLDAVGSASADRAAMGARNRALVESRADWQRNFAAFVSFLKICAGFRGAASTAGPLLPVGS